MAPGASRLADISDQGTATALDAHKALGLLAMRYCALPITSKPFGPIAGRETVREF
jgi:hypothetical protein